MGETNGFVIKEVGKKNGGFSIVELIIVVAIMAVLVGVVGAQVIPYLENSRIAKDEQILSGYVTAGMSAYSFHAESAPTEGEMKVIITRGAGGGGTDVYTCSEAQDIADELQFLIGNNRTAVTAPENTFSSKNYKKIARIEVIYDFDTATISVEVFDNSNVRIATSNPISGRL